MENNEMSKLIKTGVEFIVFRLEGGVGGSEWNSDFHNGDKLSFSLHQQGTGS